MPLTFYRLLAVIYNLTFKRKHNCTAVMQWIVRNKICFKMVGKSFSTFCVTFRFLSFWCYQFFSLIFNRKRIFWQTKQNVLPLSSTNLQIILVKNSFAQSKVQKSQILFIQFRCWQKFFSCYKIKTKLQNCCKNCRLPKLNLSATKSNGSIDSCQFSNEVVPVFCKCKSWLRSLQCIKRKSTFKQEYCH